MFGGILIIITFVAVYAFYHLFSAVYRRWYPLVPSWWVRVSDGAQLVSADDMLVSVGSNLLTGSAYSMSLGISNNNNNVQQILDNFLHPSEERIGLLGFGPDIEETISIFKWKWILRKVNDVNCDRSGDLSIRPSIDTEINRSRHLLITLSIDQEIYRSGDLSIKRSIDQELYRSGGLSIRTSIDKEIYRPGNLGGQWMGLMRCNWEILSWPFH